MTALAFSLTQQGIAVVREDGLVIESEGNDVTLVEAVHKAWSPSISTLLVCRGPGSFTSVRVVLSLAAGLGAACPHLVHRGGATSFEILAHESQVNGWMLVYSHQGYFYGQPWHNGQPTDDARRVMRDDLPSNAPCILTPCPQPFGRVIHNPQAFTLMDMYKEGKLAPHNIEPFYVHSPDFKPFGLALTGHNTTKRQQQLRN